RTGRGGPGRLVPLARPGGVHGREDLDPSVDPAVAQDHRILAQARLDPGQGIARGRAEESLRSHCASPMILPIRMVWVSGISEWASTRRRGAAFFISLAIGCRIASGTSNAPGMPRPSCSSHAAAAERTTKSAT